MTIAKRLTPRTSWAVALCAWCIVGCNGSLAVNETEAVDQSVMNAVSPTMKTWHVPPVPEPLKTELAKYQQARPVSVVDWVGESLLVRTRFAETSQIHLVRTPLGMRKQVTFRREPIGSVIVPPIEDPDGFVFGVDEGGSESYQLYWFELKSGNQKLLTDGRSRFTGASYSPDGQRLAYTTNERNGTDWDIHIRNSDGTKQIVLEGQGVGWSVDDWSPDGTKMLISQYIHTTEQLLYEVDLVTGERTRLLANYDRISIPLAKYTSDSEDLIFLSDLGGEFDGLYRLDRPADAIASLVTQLKWDVQGFRLSRQRQKVAYIVNEDGYSTPYVVDLANGETESFNEFQQGLVGGLRFSPDDSKIAFTYESATSIDNVFVYEFATQSTTQWTDTELGPIAPESLIEPRLIRYPTFDDLEIPAFVYEPDRPGPHPVLVYIHGGPAAQTRPRFTTAFQFYMAQLGVAVVAPNVRGSAGYGRTYVGLDDGRLREDSVKDIGALLDWIDLQPSLDSDRVAVYGGSYGGYMVLACMVHFNDRLRAGVESVGISNFVTFLENTQGYRRDLRRVEYGDERDPEMRTFLEGIAPLNHVDQISKPLLIAQGRNDPRVPYTESEQIVAALERNDIPVWYVLAEDEGHGFRKKTNSDYWSQVIVMFLRQHLL